MHVLMTPNGILNENFWSNLKAAGAGAKEYLKRDLKHSFNSKGRDNIKIDRLDGKNTAKMRSYAKDLSQSLKNFKNFGGSVGTNIEDIHDLIIRLDRISAGKAPTYTGSRRKKINIGPATKQPEAEKPATNNASL